MHQEKDQAILKAWSFFILFYMYQFETTLENFNSALWHYHVPVSDDIASQLIEGTNRRIRLSIAGSQYQHAALMKTKEYWFFLLNKKQ